MRWRGFGFVHHSRTIFCRAVPNLSITIRNFFIAVRYTPLCVVVPYAHTPVGAANEEQVALAQVDECELCHWWSVHRVALPSGCSEAVGDNMLLPVPHPHLQPEGPYAYGVSG
jgi:hypothetical protein